MLHNKITKTYQLTDTLWLIIKNDLNRQRFENDKDLRFFKKCKYRLQNMKE